VANAHVLYTNVKARYRHVNKSIMLAKHVVSLHELQSRVAQ